MTETTTLPKGVVVSGAMHPRLRQGFDLRGGGVSRRPRAQIRSRAPPPARPPGRDPAAAGCRVEARFRARNRGGARRRLAGGAGPARPPRPPHRDHRPDRPQDGDQRLELRGECVHGRFRGREHGELGQFDRRPSNSARRGAPHDSLRRSADRPALSARRRDCGAVRAPARLASAGKPCPRRWRRDVGSIVRLRTVLLP